MSGEPRKTVPEILADARHLLATRGWHRGSMYPGSREHPPKKFDDGMPLCLLAACRVADTGCPWSGDAQEATDALQETLEQRFDRPVAVGPWQDGFAGLADVLKLIDETLTRVTEAPAAEPRETAAI